MLSKSKKGSFIYSFLPVASLAMITLINSTAGGIFGALLAFVLTIFAPLYVIPILMFAGSYRLMGMVGFLQYGWIIVLGFIAGSFINYKNDNGNKKWLFSAVVFFICILIHIIFNNTISINRSIMHVVMIVGIGIFINTYMSNIRVYGIQNVIKTFFYSISSASIVISITAFIMLSMGSITTERSNEVSFAMGENSSSPSNLTRIVGVAVIFSLFRYFSAPNSKFKDSLIYILAALLGVITMLYGGSRMPMFALGAALLFFIFRSSKEIKRRFFKSLIYGAIIYGGFAINTQIIESGKIEEESNVQYRIERPPEIESNIRLEIWEQYLSQLTARTFLIGNGIGQANFKGIGSQDTSNPHSVYYGFFVSFGLIGVILCIYLFSTLFKVFFSYQSAIGKSFLIYILAIFSSNGDVDKLHFWIVFLLIYLYALLEEKEHGLRVKSYV